MSVSRNVVPRIGVYCAIHMKTWTPRRCACNSASLRSNAVRSLCRDTTTCGLCGRRGSMDDTARALSTPHAASIRDRGGGSLCIPNKCTNSSYCKPLAVSVRIRRWPVKKQTSSKVRYMSMGVIPMVDGGYPYGRCVIVIVIVTLSRERTMKQPEVLETMEPRPCCMANTC